MPSLPADCVDTMLFNLLCILTVNMTDQERRSGRNKKPTERYIGWYGFRMLMASRTKQIQSHQLKLSLSTDIAVSGSLPTVPDEVPENQSPVTDVVASGSLRTFPFGNDQVTDVQGDGEEIHSPLEYSDNSDYAADMECDISSDDRYRSTVRNKIRRATGYTILKRRRHELRKKFLSFSPPPERKIFRRLIIPDDSDEDCEGDYENSADLATETISVSEGAKEHARCRKRLRNGSMWKRNVQKRARIEGKEYTAANGKCVPAKFPKLDESLCTHKCRLNCGGNISNDMRSQIFTEYYAMSHEAQNAHLFACLKCSPPKSALLNTDRPRGITVRYTVTSGGSTISVCKKAFMNLFLISQSKVDHIVQQARSGQAAARPSLRGKHDNRPNRISQQKIEEVKEHINLYPAERSHYSRHRNPNRMYLASTLTISDMFRHYQTWTAERGVVAVSSAAYRKIFNTQFNLGFGSPRSDVCSRCEADRVDGKSSEHVQLAEAAFSQQKLDRAEARENEGVHYITFDMQKTMPLPKLAVSKAFYLRQIWLYNTGVHVIDQKKERCFFHIWTEDAGGRGVSEVISCLVAFFQVSGISGGRLRAWSDSCAGQNKNNIMINFWQYVIARKLFTSIEHKFPEPGHSFLDSDRDFAHVEALVRRRENIYTVDEYCDILNNSTRAHRCVVTRMNDKMCDLSTIKAIAGNSKVATNSDGNRVQLRDKVRWIKVQQFGSYQYKHSFSDGEPWKEVILTTDACPADSETNAFLQIPVLAAAKHKIKNAKVNDIKKQLEFIPSIYRGYYNKVIQEHEDDGDAEVDSDDDDEENTTTLQEDSSAVVCAAISRTFLCKSFSNIPIALACVL